MRTTWPFPPDAVRLLGSDGGYDGAGGMYWNAQASAYGMPLADAPPNSTARSATGSYAKAESTRGEGEWTGLMSVHPFFVALYAQVSLKYPEGVLPNVFAPLKTGATSDWESYTIGAPPRPAGLVEAWVFVHVWSATERAQVSFFQMIFGPLKIAPPKRTTRSAVESYAIDGAKRAPGELAVSMVHAFVS